MKKLLIGVAGLGRAFSLTAPAFRDPRVELVAAADPRPEARRKFETDFGGRAYAGVEELKVAVMGCVVNGPGESKHADIGISLPGTFEEPKAPVYMDGRLLTTLKGDRIVEEFLVILDEYVARKYGARETAGV